MQFGEYVVFVVKDGMQSSFFTGTKEQCSLVQRGIELAGGQANLVKPEFSPAIKPKLVKVQLWRNATKSELKFGMGCIHYNEIELPVMPKRIFAKTGGYSRPARAKGPDGLMYNVQH